MYKRQKSPCDLYFRAFPEKQAVFDACIALRFAADSELWLWYILGGMFVYLLSTVSMAVWIKLLG